MQKIIKNPIQLSEDQQEHFSLLFEKGEYQVVTCIPDEHNIPESLIPSSKEAVTYREILQDDDAFLRYFAIAFQGRDNIDFLIPIGVYGCSEKRGLRFPLLLNGFWQMFLMADPVAFANIVGIEDSEECQFYFKNLISLKKSFSTKVFKYFSE